MFSTLKPSAMSLEEPFPSIRYIIFDCDGVLVDSEILASQTVLAMLRPYGFMMNKAEYGSRFSGKIEEDILTIVQNEYGIALPDSFLTEVRSAIERRLDSDLQPIAGMREVVESLSVPKAIVSNSRLRRVMASLNTTHLSDLFSENLFAVDMVERPKPAPDIYLYAMQKLRARPAECLVVEDSFSGVTAAYQAGAQVIGFSGASHVPAGHDKMLKQAGAQMITADAGALRELLDSMSLTIK